jgi:6-pyruvoyltetrahydropterin/6-carboxytetrahydropterin synthase
MYSLAVSHHFMVAHSLRGAVFGPAQQLHGITCAIEVELRRARLDPDGVVCDIGLALDLVRSVVADLDYRNLDDMAEFAGQNTTTEFLAGDLHRRLSRRIRDGGLGADAAQAIDSLRVVLRESPVAWAAYDAPLE